MKIPKKSALFLLRTLTYVPNCLSLSRIPLSFLLLQPWNVDWFFFCTVILIGLTDVADGYLARKLHLVTKWGARLDSLSDLVFFAALFWIVYTHHHWILTHYSNWFFILLLIKIITFILLKAKRGEFTFLHTLASKATGLMIFLFSTILPFAFSKSLLILVFLVASYAAVEELSIVLLSKEIDLNQKSILGTCSGRSLKSK